MAHQYRIHFGFSKSSRYRQALELARLTHQHEVKGSGQDSWHIFTFTDEQLDIMAQAYFLVRGFRLPKVDGVGVDRLHLYVKHIDWRKNINSPKTRSIRSVAERIMTEKNFSLSQFMTFLEETYLKTIYQDMEDVRNKLGSEGYLETFNKQTYSKIEPGRKPEEHIPIYIEIRVLISRGQYTEAVGKYYEALDSKPFGELHQELLYLKRLANIPLAGRDILAFNNEASRSDLIKDNLWQYCSCMDSVLETFQRAGRSSTLEILIKSVPTLEELVQRTQQWLNKGVCLWNGELRRDTTRVTVDFWGTFKCPKGRLFDRYPNPLIYHWDEEETPDEVFHPALWTMHKPSFIEVDILQKGFHLSGIEAYKHRKWRLGQSKKREPDFMSLLSLQDVVHSKYFISGIRYTGRTHQIGDKEFYEIDLLRKAPWSIERSLPSLEELADDVLREGENLLREQHGLPRIGEGWVSEMQLYNLVKEVFPDAHHHVIPNWLKPQEIDVYVQSKKLAFEYQGIQHYQPVDFFGGEEAFNQRRRMDLRKKQKCGANGIVLVEWRFDEPINRALLIKKLKEANVEP